MDNQPENESRLRRILAEVLKVDDVDCALGDDLVQELGLDSLAGLRLLATVEKRFGVRFPDDRLREFRTLRQILDVIATQSEENQP